MSPYQSNPPWCITLKVEVRQANDGFIQQGTTLQQKWKLFDASFLYCSVIGMLNFLEESTQPKISFTIHQCIRYSAILSNHLGETVQYITKYLGGIRDDITVLVPWQQCQFWRKLLPSMAMEDSMWKLLPLITLSTTEAWLISLIDCLKAIILIVVNG